MGKRFGFILGWFAVLFLFNVVVHQNPTGNRPIDLPIIRRSGSYWPHPSSLLSRSW